MAFSLFFPVDTLEFTQGDTRPVLNFQITNDQDPPQPINLAGILVFFTLKKNQDTSYKFKRECMHIDDPNGLAGFNWQAGDFDVAGRYKGEVELNYPDGTVQSQVTPFDFNVRPQLDATPPVPVEILPGTVGAITREDLSVQIDTPPGRVSFITTYRFVLGTLSVFLNGLELGIRGKHFVEDSLTSKGFTLTGVPPVLGDELFVEYIVAYPTI